MLLVLTGLVIIGLLLTVMFGLKAEKDSAVDKDKK